MSTAIKSSKTPEVDVRIAVLKGGNENWFIKPIKVAPNSRVTWHCRLDRISIWFPKDKNPLAGKSNEVYGKNGKATAIVGSKPGKYFYCILITEDNGQVHLVESNSPPEMEIG
jgi:hypothetical protein